MIAGGLMILASSVAIAQGNRLKVDISAVIQDGYGRMVITFSERDLLPRYSAKVANSILVIEFDEPMDADVSNVPVDLIDFITVARHDPDGRAVRFALGKTVRVNTMEAGEKLFIDLLPATWRGLPPGLPEDVVADLAKRAAKALREARDAKRLGVGDRLKPRLEVRVGRAPTFSRFVFAWNMPFDTSFVRETSLLTLKFSRLSMPDLGAIRANLPPGLEEINAYNEDGKTRLVLKIDPAVDVRAFSDGNTYIVDIEPKREIKSSGVDPVERAIRKALKPIGAPEKGSVFLAKGRRASIPANTPKPGIYLRTPAAGGKEKPAGLADTFPKQPVKPVAGADKLVPGAPRLEVVKGGAVDAATRKKIELAIGAAKQVSPDRKIAPTTRGRGNPEKLPKSAKAYVGDAIRVEATRIGEAVRVRFPFPDPVSAASFRRGINFWTVFDTAKALDLRSLHSSLSPQVTAIKVFKFPDWTAVRFSLSGRHLVTMGLDGSAWSVGIGNLILDPTTAVAFKRVVRGDGTMVLRAPFKNSSALRVLRDPSVGDDILVVTGHGPLRNMLKRQDFVELSSLISAHGVAVVRRADDVQVTRNQNYIEVSAGKGLTLSDGAISGPDAPIATRTDSTRTGFINFRSLATKSPPAFRAAKADLERKIAESPKKHRRRARLELAKFFLAHRYAYEALAYLRLIGKEDMQSEADPGFNVLQGAANALAGRPLEARKYLKIQKLSESADAAVWRSIAEAQLANWGAVRAATPRANAVIGNYPVDLQAEFGIAAARAAIELNDVGGGSRLLAEIDISNADGAVSARYDLLRGRIADIMGRPKDALRHFETVIKSKDRPAAAAASYRAMRIRYRDNLADADTVLRELEGLTAIWRGDEIELKALRFLAELSAKQAKYRRAFQAMKTALIANPRARTTQLLQDEMVAVFANLFLGGEASAMGPVEALSLFYDFRELTPVGRRGDELVRQLANRLVEVDLLGQASSLLEHQVDHRLKGAARAQIAADLAVVFLLDRKPEQALRAIHRSRQARLPVELDRQRRLVEARAYVSLGKYDLALELLKNLRGPDAMRLLWAANWEAKRWRPAAEAIERLHGGRWADKTPMRDQEKLEILRAGIAYTLAGDDLGLDRLRTKYTAKMAKSKYAKAFDVVTRPIRTNDLEFAAVVRQIASLDSMDAFLEEYRRQYLTTGDQSAPQVINAPGEKPTAAKPFPTSTSASTSG